MRHRKRSRQPRIRLWIAAAIAAGGIFGDLSPVPHLHQSVGQTNLAKAVPAIVPVSRRPVFRHSVIPGGAYTVEEVAGAVARDPAVREHYSVFHSSRLRFLHASAPRSAYVSYRVANAIYWTRKPLPLPAGELLISDGAHMARARCGNRLSDTPQQPVSEAEPSAEDLDVADPLTEDWQPREGALAVELFPALVRGPSAIPARPPSPRSDPASPPLDPALLLPPSVQLWGELPPPGPAVPKGQPATVVSPVTTDTVQVLGDPAPEDPGEIPEPGMLPMTVLSAAALFAARFRARRASLKS